MQAEATYPIINELPINEKRKLLGWLKEQVNEPLKIENKNLKQILIKHITK